MYRFGKSKEAIVATECSSYWGPGGIFLAAALHLNSAKLIHGMGKGVDMCLDMSWS